MMKRKSMFGAGVTPDLPPMPGVISGYGGGTFNMDGTQATPVNRGGFDVPIDGGPPMPEAAAEQAPKSGGFFGQGGVGRGIAGSIGDYLQQANGFEPTFAPAMAQRRQMEFLQKRQEQSRETDWADYVRKQEYERANPAPTQPHYWETNDGSLGSIGPDGKPQVIYKDPTPKVEWVTAQNPDGTKTLIPMPQGGGAAPTKPVGKLRPIGGPTAPQSGGFR